MERKAIDISTHNGNVDFNRVKAAGINDVILRCGVTTYGTGLKRYEDDKFEENYKKAKAAGLNVGAYYYAIATEVQHAEWEAAFVLELLKGKTFELPIYYDVEDSHDTDALGVHPRNMQKLGKTKLTQIVNRFCEIVEGAGYYTGIYSSTWWFNELLDMSILDRYTLWLAQWTEQPTYKGDFGVWQYTDKGKVDGVTGYVDMNIIYNDFTPIIKRLGLNGFTKQEPEQPEEKPAEKPTAANAVYLTGGATADGIVNVKVTQAQAQEIARLAGLL